MTTYEISTLIGRTSLDWWTGSSPIEALAAMHREAGYRVNAIDGALVWDDTADEEICGGLDRWTIRPVGLYAVLINAGVPANLRSMAAINRAIEAAMPEIGVTNRDWWGFPRASMRTADWAHTVSLVAPGAMTADSAK